MTTVQFLAYLKESGVRLSAEGETLRVRAPEGVLTAALRAHIASRKADILAFLSTASALPALLPAPAQRHAPFPLTDVQQAYWVGRSAAFELGNVATHAYMEIDACHLDIARLNDSWCKLVERHEMLRAIVTPEGQQVILPAVPHYVFEVLDLSAWEDAARTAKLDEVRQFWSHHVLPAGQWPLFDVRVTRLGAERLRLHFSLDALIADAFSLMILLREWQTLYDNPAATLPSLDLSIRDYVLTTHAMQQSELYKRAEAYWRNRLDSLPPPPDLPLAVHPASIVRPRFKRRQAQVKASDWERLKDWARGAGLTPSSVLLTAYAEVLGTWNRNPAFTINLTLFNRLPLHPQVNALVGDFTSLTLLEVHHLPDEPFNVRALRLQEQLWQDLDQRYYNGVQVVRELARRQTSAPRALMPVVFTGALAWESLGQGAHIVNAFGDMVYSISQTPQTWLDHQVFETPDGLFIAWDAVDDLFPAGLLDDMFDAFCRRLQTLTTHEQCLSEPTPLLLPAEQLAHREQVNRTAAPLSDQLLYSGFLEQAAARPEALAVITAECHVTYRALARAAMRLAQALRRRDVAPDTLVAVVLQKGWEQVAAVLGVTLAGAAYLPIDPELPEARRHLLLHKGEVRIALTAPGLVDSDAWPSGIECVPVEASLLEGADAPPVPHTARPENLAYVIYTSGSSGEPKGVVIDHQGAVNTVLDINRRFALHAGDCVFGISALSFDLSVFDIFGTLACGATLLLPPPDATRDPAVWAGLMARHRTTVWNSVPALMQVLVDYLAQHPDAAPAHLRLAMLSGDWIPVALPDHIRELWPEAQVISLGGATEASIWSIFHPIGAVAPDCKSIPYGTPLTNQRWHVLNASLAPCPVWVPGDLYIGGVGLARGYWRDATRTQAAFFPHPVTGEQLYKTGDLGRYLPDGTIEFLGREDLQVKVNGYRVELSEIESALQELPEVEQAVVAAVGDRQRDKQLVAYIVPAPAWASGQPGGLPVGDFIPQEDRQDLLRDPLARAAFKLQQPGRRQANAGETRMALPTPGLDAERQARYLQRQSHRSFLTEPVPREPFHTWLYALAGRRLDHTALPTYRYPSAGSLYPVQTYLYVWPGGVEDLEAGYYYYDPMEHTLAWLGAMDTAQAHEGDPSARFLLFLVAHLDAIAPMYGRLGRDFCLLEAGYIGQLLMTEAPQAGIGLCPLGYYDYPGIAAALSLNGDRLLLHSFMGGKIRADHTHTWSGAMLTRPYDLRDRIREQLMHQLPSYMVPTTCIALDHLPLSPNGKVDRKALPIAGGPITPAATDFIAPQTDLEQQLASIIRAVLGIETVGLYNNFFDLGANSVHLIHLQNRIRDVLDKDVPILELFTHPNLAYLANRLQGAPAAQLDFDRVHHRMSERQAAHRRQRPERRRASMEGTDRGTL